MVVLLITCNPYPAFELKCSLDVPHMIELTQNHKSFGRRQSTRCGLYLRPLQRG